MDESEDRVRCPRCGAMPKVQNLGYGRGFKMFCPNHAIGFETWGETFTEAEDAWVKYCAKQKESKT